MRTGVPQGHATEKGSLGAVAWYLIRRACQDWVGVTQETSSTRFCFSCSPFSILSAAPLPKPYTPVLPALCSPTCISELAFILPMGRLRLGPIMSSGPIELDPRVESGLPKCPHPSQRQIWWGAGAWGGEQPRTVFLPLPQRVAYFQGGGDGGGGSNSIPPTHPPTHPLALPSRHGGLPE